MDQETSFPFELVVGDDVSTDQTRAIALDYSKRYPTKVRLLFRDTRLGSQQNLWQTLRACQGKYVAMLDGDDYWTSSHKLQKQVDFLESHLECTQCFHAVTVFEEGGSVAPYVKRSSWRGSISTLKQLIESCCMQTSSTMFRNGLITHLPPWFDKVLEVDWLIFILNAEHGYTGYLDDVMAAYRIHPRGIWSGLTAMGRRQDMLQFYDRLNGYFNRRFNAFIRSATAHLCHQLATAYAERGNRAAAKHYALKYLARRPLNSLQAAEDAARVLSLVYAPAPVHQTLSIFYRRLKAVLRRLTLSGDHHGCPDDKP